MTEELKEQYIRVKTEADRRKRTIRCCNTLCSKVLHDGTGDINEMEEESLQCIRCSTETCTACRKEHHEGECKHNDPRTNLLYHFVSENGGQECPSCEEDVLRRGGCPRMT